MCRLRFGGHQQEKNRTFCFIPIGSPHIYLCDLAFKSLEPSDRCQEVVVQVARVKRIASCTIPCRLTHNDISGESGRWRCYSASRIQQHPEQSAAS